MESWNQGERVVHNTATASAAGGAPLSHRAVYSFIWAYYIRSLPQGTIGVVFQPPSQGSRQLDLIRVSPGSSAESAGLLPGDRIVEINGPPLDTIEPWVDLVARAKPNSDQTRRQEMGGRLV
jgi:S1-C subfamily serine protease